MTMFTHTSSKASTHVSTTVNVRVWQCAAIFGSLLLASACARFIPADPYKNTQTVNVLAVPEGKVRPAVDPSLAVPEGKTAWMDNGHTPPAVAAVSAAKPEITPKIDEKTGDDE